MLSSSPMYPTRYGAGVSSLKAPTSMGLNVRRARRVFCSMKEHQPLRPSWRKALLKTASRTLLVSFVCVTVTAAVLPSFLSSQMGLNVALWFTNQTIPGKFKVGKASLGWRKPVELDDIYLEDGDGEDVLRIRKIMTQATLWSILAGKRGLGDCKVSSLWMNLLDDEETGIPRLTLALERVEKYKKTRATKRQPANLPTRAVKLFSEVTAPGGGLRLDDGELLVSADIAAVLGRRLFVSVLVGPDAEETNGLLEPNGHLPVQVDVSSECLHAEAAGCLHPWTRKLELNRPFKIEMDLTPELGRLYLSRVNPLLGYVVGPAVTDKDMVVLEVYPENMSYPADEYRVHFQPMRVVLAKGPILDGILKLLFENREELTQGARELTMETSSIQAEANLANGVLQCQRLDVLIGGKVHVVTWGEVNWIQETMKTELAIPQSTLRNLLGLHSLPADYHFQISIKGTFDRPEFDVRGAIMRIAHLTVQQGGGFKFARKWFGGEESSDSSVPELKHGLPWDTDKSGL